jgi:quinolinate synthase
MAAPGQVEACWQDLVAAGLDDTVPVTYINSAASIKAFCGARGGLVCTSSNAAAALEWAWGRAKRVLFLPDQHLGRNTAWKMGVPLEDMVVWEPDEPNGGLAPGAAAGARLLLWAGNCSVHMGFTVAQIERLRARHPAIRVIVHPECTWDVVQAADDSGSTEYIVKTITTSPAGTVWGVGTETHLVQRLARTLHPEKTVISLEPFGCLCSTMFRISPNHLLWILEELLAGRVHNRITVGPEEKALALAALDRMLALA